MYDVFISFKNTDKGIDTVDSMLADKLYHYIKSKGLSVFMSKNTLSENGDSDYKMAIDKALDESKFLIAIATKPSYVESRWVRYEWDSFCNDIISGIKKDGKIFTLIRDMSANELPRALRQTQVFQIADNIEQTFETLYQFLSNAVANKPATATAPSAAPLLKNYSVIGYDEIVNANLDFRKIVGDLLQIIHDTMDDLSDHMLINTEESAKIMERSTDTWKIIVDKDGKPVGHWFFVPLYEDAFNRAMQGNLLEEEITYNNIDYLNVPGYYKGYFLQIEILREHRNVRTFQMLLKSFLQQIQDLAEQGIFFTDWCANAASPEGESLAKSLGMNYLCDNVSEGKVYYNKFIPIPSGITFYRTFPRLRELYDNAQDDC